MEDNNNMTLPLEEADNNITESPVSSVEYTDDNIRHLDDMEHIRVRSGMYIGRLGDGSQNDDGIYVILLSASSSGRVILLLSSISTLFLHIAHCDKGNEKFGGSQKNNVFYGLLTSLYSGFRTYFIPFTKHLLRLCCSVLKYSHCACTLPFSSSSGLLSAYSKPSC